MESRSILMLASVAMILVVAGIGNAFAVPAPYQNEVQSELYIDGADPAARITSNDSDIAPEAHVGEGLVNVNEFANFGSSSWGLVNVWWTSTSVYQGSTIIIPLKSDPHQYNLAVGQTAKSSETSNEINSNAVPGTVYPYTQAATYVVSTYPWSLYGYSTNPASVKNFKVV